MTLLFPSLASFLKAVSEADPLSAPGEAHDKLRRMLSFVRRPEVLEEFECCNVAALDALEFSQPFCSISS